VVGGKHITPLARAQAAPTTFIMLGMDVRYGKGMVMPGTLPQGPRRQPLPWGSTSATAPTCHGPPHFFDDGSPAGWQLVMGDFAADTSATEARRTRRIR
jgi:hypothetical protein